MRVSDACAGVLEAGFAEYLKNFTDAPAPAELLDREGAPRQPFLKRSLPPQVLLPRSSPCEYAASHAAASPQSCRSLVLQSFTWTGTCKEDFLIGMPTRWLLRKEAVNLLAFTLLQMHSVAL